jgi:hypothetical protein
MLCLFSIITLGIASSMSTVEKAPLLIGRINPTTYPALTSDIPGTWAFDTMSRRVVEEIIPRVIADNEEELTRPTSSHRSECLLQLNDLISSLKAGSTGILRGIADEGSDVNLWNDIVFNIPEDKRNWLNAPWLITEFYLYRRLAEAFRFFETGYDHFSSQKVKGLLEALPSISDIASRLPTLLKNCEGVEDKKVAIEVAVLTSLWGNKMDLSLWPASSAKTDNDSGIEDSVNRINFGEALNANKPYILDDHLADVVNTLSTCLPNDEQSVVDIVVDNAGYELVSDMLLGHSLLSIGVCNKVRFHTKGMPTFVSDATNGDCSGTLHILSTSEDTDTAALGKQMTEYAENGKFEFIEDLFWCQPQPFWDMPQRIQSRIQDSKMVFVKGDANYRRLLGERDWPMDTPASDILSYWPVPVCALRTFESNNVGCGLNAKQQSVLIDPVKASSYGIIQFKP